MSSEFAELLSAVPEKYRGLLEQVITDVEKELNDESTWQLHSEKHGVKAYTRLDGNLTAAKGVGFVPYHPRAIAELFIDPAKKTLVDTQCGSCESVAEFGAHTSINYLQYKSVLFVSGRDFVCLTHWRVLDDGTILIVAKSVEDLELCPEQPKYVRGEVHISATKIVPNEAYDGAEVTYMVKTDLKGSIPYRVASSAAAQQPYLVQRTAEALKKYKNMGEYVAKGKLTNEG